MKNELTKNELREITGAGDSRFGDGLDRPQVSDVAAGHDGAASDQLGSDRTDRPSDIA